MGVSPAVFQSGGKLSQHVIPGGYSRIDFVQGFGGNASANNAVIMGDSRGGEPNKLLWFSSPSEAEDVLRDGSLLDAIRLAFSPGGGYVPQRIGAMRVNPGTQASYNVQGGGETQIVLKAWDYGLHGNQVKFKIENGTTTGKKLTVKFQTEDEIVTDNIAKSAFKIQYTGSGSTVTMDITKLKLTTTVDASGDLDLEFATYGTVQDLVNYINDQDDYTAEVVGGAETLETTKLDSLSSQNIKTSEYTALANLQALIDAMGDIGWFGSATFNSSATSRSVPDNLSSWTYLTGATDGAYTASEWAASLTAMESEDVQMIASPSTDSAVHLLIKAHVSKMNSVTGKSERQALLGGAASETVAQVKTRAQNLALDTVLLGDLTFKQYDSAGVIQIWAPSYYACMLMGQAVALALPEPMTNKEVNILEVVNARTDSEIEELIKGGVCVARRDRTGRFVTVRSVTTFQTDTLQRNEFSMMRTALYVSRDLRTTIEQSFVGRAATNSLLSDIDATASRKLVQYTDLGFFSGDPAYQGYKRTVAGDQVKIEFEANLTAPTNFVFITSHLTVFSDLAA